VSRVHDVAIVGGGPVGMLLAVQLARAGRDVLVIEERTEIAPRPRAIGIHPPAVEALAEAGVDVSAHGRPIVEGVAMADGRELGRLPLDGVVALAQQDAERMLRARLASLAPDALVLGRRVRSVHGGPDGDRVLTDDRDVRHTTRLVVGADGVRSVVRAAAGVGMPARGATAHYLMADVDDDGGVGDRAILCFEREGVVESFPLPGGRRRWVALVPRPREDADFAEFAAIVHDRTLSRSTATRAVVLRELACRAVSTRRVPSVSPPDDPPVLEHDDLVGVDHGRQPVRDHDEGAVLGDGVDRVAEELLVESVERRGRLVEQQDRRGGEQGAGDRQSLAFAAGEHDAVFADLGEPGRVVALEHTTEVDRAQHLDALLVGRVRAAECEVVAHLPASTGASCST
jgi:hypothetical protein